MQNFSESILASRFSKGMRWNRVLAARGVLSHHPMPGADLGRAWKKLTRKGEVYYKMKFFFILTAKGKPLYAKARERKSEPGVYYANAMLTDDELPLRQCFKYLERPSASGSF